ncbi:MAG: winged helix-turn-helix transcriptional regulator [Actinobacteria bacterium]|nr:MAG: winged helix-turn-helix transcriptional regulator [Actinomycetota bacterium]
MAIAAGSGARGVLAEIDQRLAEIERKLEGHRALISERDRLFRARATLLGEPAAGRVSQDDVASYLTEHPGARPGEIAKALGVASGTVSAHLFRGKRSRFSSRGGGWYVRRESAGARRR